MSKSTHPVINKFMEAVYPENVELAFASFNEITALGDAADKILSLRARVKELEEELKDGDYWQERAKAVFESGVCPICFCDDESGHEDDCYIGQCEERAETAEARLARAEGLLGQWMSYALTQGIQTPVNLLYQTRSFRHPEQEKEKPCKK